MLANNNYKIHVKEYTFWDGKKTAWYIWAGELIGYSGKREERGCKAFLVDMFINKMDKQILCPFFILFFKSSFPSFCHLTNIWVPAVKKVPCLIPTITENKESLPFQAYNLQMRLLQVDELNKHFLHFMSLCISK